MAEATPEATAAPTPPLALGPSASRDVGSVVDYLTRTGDMYKQHIELLRRRQEAREMELAPFKPTITPYAEAAAKTSVLRQSETIEDRLHHLHQKKIEREAQMRAQQQAAEEAIIGTYSFEPRVTQRAERLERRGDVVDTLAKWQVQRDAHVADMQERQTLEELSRVRDRPRISAFAHEVAAKQRPQDVSIEDYLSLQEEKRRRRQYALTELHWSYHDDSVRGGGARGSPVPHSRRSDGADTSVLGVSSIRAASPATGAMRKPFSPSISSHASTLHRPGNVAERLYQTSLEQTREEDLYDEAYAMNCSFRPTLSALSRQLSHSRYTDPSVRAKPTHERLYLNPPVEPKYRRRPKVTAAEEEAALHPHRPQISETSRVLVEAMRQQQETGGGESPSSRLHRTGLQGTGKKKKGTTFKKPVITPKEREAREETTFKPKVSDWSEKLWARKVNMLKGDGHARTEEEARMLLWRQAQKKKEDDLRRRKALTTAEQMLECTFQPKAGRPPVGKFGYEPAHALTVAERAQLWTQQKEKRLEQLRAELETEADESINADCTFQPHVHEAYPLPRRRAPTAAEDTFVERQREARRRREEAEQWWRPKPGNGNAHNSMSSDHPTTTSRNSTSGRGRTKHQHPPSMATTTIDSFKLGPERRKGQSQMQHRSTRSLSRSTASAYTCDESDDDDDEDYSFQPQYPTPSPQREKADGFVVHHLPQQPNPTAAYASVAMDSGGAKEERRGDVSSSWLLPFRPVPATREAERSRPSPLDAYRGAA